MKLISILTVLCLSIAVSAKDKTKTKAESAKKPKVIYGELPGNGRPDHHFAHLWDNMIKDQKFPILPKVGEFDMSDEERDRSTDDRKRYIFHMDTSAVNMKTLELDPADGYYKVAYSTKGQGTLFLVFLPKYRKCFDDLTKKFDEMQWVVLFNQKIEDPEGKGPTFAEIILEQPRQCVGALKSTGSKLPTAKGDITNP